MVHNDEWWENEYYKALDRDLLREYDEQMNREEYPDDIITDDVEGYARPCGACFGTGTQRNGDYVRICVACDGTGIHADPEQEAEDLIDSAFVHWDEEQQPTVSWWAD